MFSCCLSHSSNKVVVNSYKIQIKLYKSITGFPNDKNAKNKIAFDLLVTCFPSPLLVT